MLACVIVTRKNAFLPSSIFVVAARSWVGRSCCFVSAFWSAVFFPVIADLFAKCDSAILARQIYGRLRSRSTDVCAFTRAKGVSVFRLNPESFSALFALFVRALPAISLVGLLKFERLFASVARLDRGYFLSHFHAVIIPGYVSFVQRYADAFDVRPELITEDAAELVAA